MGSLEQGDERLKQSTGSRCRSNGHQVHWEGGWMALGYSLAGSADRVGSEVFNMQGLSHPACPRIRPSWKGVPRPLQNKHPVAQGPTQTCSQTKA